MTTTYRAAGDSIPFTAAATLTAGQGLLLNELFGVVHSDAASGESAVLIVEGIHELTVLGTDVVAIGEPLYWDDGNSRLTKTASTHLCVGKAAGASANGVTTVEVKLMPGLEVAAS